MAHGGSIAGAMGPTATPASLFPLTEALEVLIRGRSQDRAQGAGEQQVTGLSCEVCLRWRPVLRELRVKKKDFRPSESVTCEYERQKLGLGDPWWFAYDHSHWVLTDAGPWSPHWKHQVPGWIDSPGPSSRCCLWPWPYAVC